MAPLAFSTYASNFLKNPTALRSNRTEEDEEEPPLFYSTHNARQSQLFPHTSNLSSSAHPNHNTSHIAGSSSSTASILRIFDSHDSFAQSQSEHEEGTGAVSEGGGGNADEVELSGVLFNRHGESEENTDDDNDDGGEYLGRVEREEREGRNLLTVNPRPSLPTAPSNRGWMAHQSLYPSLSANSRSQRSSSSSTSTSSSSNSSSSHSTDSADDIPPEFLDESEDEDDEGRGGGFGGVGARGIIDLPRSSPAGGMVGSSVLEERLLGGVGEGSASVERLAPIRGGWGGRGDWRKFRDSPFLALHLTCLLALFVFLPFTCTFRPTSSLPPSPKPPSSAFPPTPFTTLLHTLPLLSLLLLFSTSLPPFLLFLLIRFQRTIRYTLLAVSAAVPLGFAACGWWMFVGTFEAGGVEEATQDGTIAEAGKGWWAGTGLRILSLIPFLLAGLSGRLFWVRRKKLSRTVSVVELASTLLLAHPPLLLLTPCLLLAFTLISLPIITVLFRLLLLGYFETPSPVSYSYHLEPKAGWLIAVVVGLWVWTWGVLRGIGRVTISAVVGEWFFHRNDENLNLRPRETDPFGFGYDIETTRIAFNRATGSSLGSICFSSLVMTILNLTRQTASYLRRATSPRTLARLPAILQPLEVLEPSFGFVVGVLDQLNEYALVYVGITGEPFLHSARAVGGLIVRGKGKGGRKILDYTLINLILNLSTLTIALLSSSLAYPFSLHALASPPSHAPLVGLFVGSVTFLVVRFGLDALVHASDALFICYAIDAENGGQSCPQAGRAFTGKSMPSANSPRRTGIEAV